MRAPAAARRPSVFAPAPSQLVLPALPQMQLRGPVSPTPAHPSRFMVRGDTLASPESPWSGIVDLEADLNLGHVVAQDPYFDADLASPPLVGAVPRIYPPTSYNQLGDVSSAGHQGQFGFSGGIDNHDDDYDDDYDDDDDDFQHVQAPRINYNQFSLAPQHPQPMHAPLHQSVSQHSQPHQPISRHSQSYQPVSRHTQPHQPVEHRTPTMQRFNHQQMTPQSGPNAKDLNLVATNSLPSRFQCVFPFASFNTVQSACFNCVYNESVNLVVSAPTGSGKTGIMELAILRLVNLHGDQARVVYIAPTKALCSERTRDWQIKFATLGLTCQEMTGDTDYKQMGEIQRSNVIVTTPEKWDTMLRRWRDYRHLMRLLRLVLLDEVHMLKDSGRGATLEVVVSRMRTVNHEIRAADQRDRAGINSSGDGIRFLAVSATVPNVADICEWLKDDAGSPAVLKSFGEEHRPVRLVREVLGFPNTTKASPFVFERSLDYKLMDVIVRFSARKPVLVFCSTRKSAITAAEHLAGECKNTGTTNLYGGPATGSHPFLPPGAAVLSQLQDVRNRMVDRRLGDLLVQGVGFHHGGMAYQDRQNIERLFLEGSITVICTTSTLAVGVNLPAHLVVVKGTCQYINGQFVQYSSLDIEQMVGRAGRPQFDDSGVAVIMTSVEQRDRMLEMITGREVIESSLHENLIEHLNAEVVLGSISSLSLALEWLRSTFLHVRIQKNPGQYKLKNCTKEVGKLSADTRLRAMFLNDLERLRESGLVNMAAVPNATADPSDLNDNVVANSPVAPTDYGKAMAKYYLKYESVINFIHLRKGANLREVLEALCKAKEFDMIRFHSDKAHLNALNKNPDIRFPIKGRISTIDQKINILLQCCLGSVSFTEQKSMHAMGSETTVVLQHAARVSRCACDIFAARGDYTALVSALTLAQEIRACTWDTSRFQLKQLDGIGPQLARGLATAGITTLDALVQAGPRKIEMAVGRNMPFGNKIMDAAATLPKLTMTVVQVQTHSGVSAPQTTGNGVNDSGGKKTNVVMNVTLALENPDTAKTFGRRGPLYCDFVAGCVGIDSKSSGKPTSGIRTNNKSTHDMDENCRLVDFRRIVLSKLKTGETFTVVASAVDSACDAVQCTVMCEDYVGLNVTQTLVPRPPWVPKANAVAKPSSAKIVVIGDDEDDFDDLINDKIGIVAQDLDDDLISLSQHATNNGGGAAISKYFAAAAESKPANTTTDTKPDEPNQEAAKNQTSGIEKTVPCSHKCRNKPSCSHKCCKHGIPDSRAAKRKQQHAPQNGHGFTPLIKTMRIDTMGGHGSVTHAMRHGVVGVAPPPSTTTSVVPTHPSDHADTTNHLTRCESDASILADDMLLASYADDACDPADWPTWIGTEDGKSCVDRDVVTTVPPVHVEPVVVNLDSPGEQQKHQNHQQPQPQQLVPAMPIVHLDSSTQPDATVQQQTHAKTDESFELKTTMPVKPMDEVGNAFRSLFDDMF